MPITKSAQKALRQNTRRQAKNKIQKIWILQNLISPLAGSKPSCKSASAMPLTLRAQADATVTLTLPGDARSITLAADSATFTRRRLPNCPSLRVGRLPPKAGRAYWVRLCLHRV